MYKFISTSTNIALLLTTGLSTVQAMEQKAYDPGTISTTSNLRTSSELEFAHAVCELAQPINNKRPASTELEESAYHPTKRFRHIEPEEAQGGEIELLPNSWGLFIDKTPITQQQITSLIKKARIGDEQARREFLTRVSNQYTGDLLTALGIINLINLDDLENLKDEEFHVLTRILHHRKEALSEGIKKTVFKIIEKKAESNSPLALLNLANCFGDGIGTTQNYESAFKCLELSAQQRNSTAQFALGVLWQSGKGTPNGAKDLQKAFYCYESSAKQGNVQAHFALGQYWEKGIGIPNGAKKDPQKAFQCYTFGAKQGHVQAYFALGQCWEYGIGTPNAAKDLKRAFIWYESIATKTGNTLAQAKLADFWECGIGTPDGQRDFQKAFAYTVQAAEKGHAESLFNLGVCWENGKGTPNGAKGLKRAFECYEQSASKGNTKAQVNLGVCWENGIGTPNGDKNPFMALQCYTLAVNQGDPLGIDRKKKLEAKLKERQVTTMVSRPSTWHPLPPQEKVVNRGIMSSPPAPQSHQMSYVQLQEAYQKEQEKNKSLTQELLVLNFKYRELREHGTGTPNNEINYEMALKYYKAGSDQGDKISHILLDNLNKQLNPITPPIGQPQLLQTQEQQAQRIQQRQLAQQHADLQNADLQAFLMWEQQCYADYIARTV